MTAEGGAPGTAADGYRDGELVDGDVVERVVTGFHPLGSHSNKIACDVCGHAGYPGCGWMDAHRRGHAPATCCGKPLTVLLNGKPRTHSRAPIGCTKRVVSR